MKRTEPSLAAILALILSLSAIPAGAEHHRPEENRCKEPIPASGDVRATKERARNSAWNQWKQQVMDIFGLEYAQREVAQKVSVKCFNASARLPFQYQCRIVATPCLVNDEAPQKL